MSGRSGLMKGMPRADHIIITIAEGPPHSSILCASAGVCQWKTGPHGFEREERENKEKKKKKKKKKGRKREKKHLTSATVSTGSIEKRRVQFHFFHSRVHGRVTFIEQCATGSNFVNSTCDFAACLAQCECVCVFYLSLCLKQRQQEGHIWFFSSFHFFLPLSPHLACHILESTQLNYRLFLVSACSNPHEEQM